MTDAANSLANRAEYVDPDLLVRALRLPAPDDCAPLILIVGPCRSGSSALLQAMSCAGYLSFFQPLKLVLRRHLAAEPAPLTIPPGEQPIILKETLGPFLMAEATFDPLQVLLRGGYPAERVSMVVMAREPTGALASWRRSFATAALYAGIDLAVFEAAYQNAANQYRDAAAAGVSVTAYVPDALAGRTDPPLEALFTRVGLSFRPEALNWSNAPAFGAADSPIVREAEPMVFRSSGSLRGLKSSLRYEQPPRRLGIEHETAAPRGAQAAYDSLVRACLRDLGHG